MKRGVNAAGTGAERDKWIRRNAYYYRTLSAFIGRTIPAGSRVLQLGSDLGQFLADLEDPALAIGVESDPDLVRLAAARYPTIEFRAADPEDFVTDRTFDWILVTDALGSFGDVQLVLERVREMLAPQGRLLISYYNYLWEPVLGLAELLGQKMRQRPRNWLPGSGLDQLLELTGFDAVRRGHLLLVPRGIPLVAPFMNRFVAQLPGLRALDLVQYVVARPAASTVEAGGMTCSVVVPCRNEAGTIAEVVDRIPQLGGHTEIIFVEGHSRDGTLDECRRVQTLRADRDIKVLVQPGVGKADAVRTGFSAATGDVLMILDADLSVGPEELPRFYRALAAGRGDLANGTRLVYPAERQAMRFLNLLANRWFAIAFGYLVGQRISDTLCGTKALRRSSYARIAADRQRSADLDPFGDFDLLIGAARLNLKIVEVPVHYRARTYGRTNISRFRHGLMLLRLLWLSFAKLKLAE